jgi:hypothetical protein
VPRHHDVEWIQATWEAAPFKDELRRVTNSNGGTLTETRKVTGETDFRYYVRRTH